MSAGRGIVGAWPGCRRSVLGAYCKSSRTVRVNVLDFDQSGGRNPSVQRTERVFQLEVVW